MKTFMQYKEEWLKKAPDGREGQMFLSWLAQEKGVNVKDAELFFCRDSGMCWNLINKKYGEHLDGLY